MMAPVVSAATLSCDPEPEQASSRPVAPASLAADLQDPFTFKSTEFDRQAVLADAVKVVQQQAADLGADACYQQKPVASAGRVDFLSPFEFLVYSLFDQNPARRDALLDQYQTDPRGAIRALGDAFPSTRAQAAMTTYAFFDVSSGRIRVNAAKVPPAEIRRVLVHEMWHAMPQSRTWTEADGRTLRASGFWLQEQGSGQRLWLPLEERRGLPYASYLLDEAMATLMETRYAGPSRFARPELDEVQRYLGKLIGLTEPGEVVGQYLGSHPEQLVQLTATHRASFPELEPTAQR
ncbi:MAG: hypothetical protein U0893_20575 [Chloroflexota bacterium]